MQTKNINVERAPNNNNVAAIINSEEVVGVGEGGGTGTPIHYNTSEKTLLMIHRGGSHGFLQHLQEAGPQQQHTIVFRDGSNENCAPPLPPRTAIIFTPLHGISKAQVEVDGYGPYKPVPPPKPLPQQPITQSSQQNQAQQQEQGCATPPPYRMPPYPLYNEPTSIPGAATGLDVALPVVAPPGAAIPSGPATPQGLHTHSNKFPIEREVILSSTDKNSKIPILHDYKKRTKGSIAPDVPPKHMAAWTQGQSHQILSPDQNHSGLVQTPHQHHQSQSDTPGAVYRASYHPTPQEYYNGGGGSAQNPSTSTGAVPRSSWHNGSSNNPDGSNNNTKPPMISMSSRTANSYQQQQIQDQDFPVGNNVVAHQQVAIDIMSGATSKDTLTSLSSKDAVSSGKNSKGVTKTYHTIKDIISSRFKSNKDANDENKADEPGLNNVTEELRRSQRNIGVAEQDPQQDSNIRKSSGEQGIYGKPQQNMSSSSGQQQQQQQQQHYSQQLTIQQQHLLAQQQYQQQVKIQQQTLYSQQQQMLQQQQASSRSQEMLSGSGAPPPPVPRPDEQQIYYQYGGATPLRTQAGGAGSRFASPQIRDQAAGYQQQMQQHPQMKDDRRQPISVERRSAQQIEWDNQRQQKTFEARRAASQPQLAYEDETITTSNQNKQQQDLQDHRPQPQTAPGGGPLRRGSHGNIMEAAAATTTPSQDPGRESDDGGFLRRMGSKEKRLDAAPGGKCQSIQEDDVSTGKVTEALQGTPRKRLEGEIGKIEGVYNVGQRTKPSADDDPSTRNKKNALGPTPGSAGSSDYDKTGGQSSSNADSGRGSAAYSSGRRPGGLDLNGDTCDTGQLAGGTYRDLGSTGHDSEWVDIVENELRHILEPKLHELSLQGNSTGMANSTLSESISSMTPPLPPLSPGEQSSPNMTPRNSARYKHSSSLPYGSKPDYEAYSKSSKLGRDSAGNSKWHARLNPKHGGSRKLDHGAALRSKQIFGLDTADLTSTTTRSLDLESMLDGQSDSEGDISTTDARAIRKQLEGLETMYSEVLKLLGVKKHNGAAGGAGGGRYQPSDPRFSKRRYGSMSSLPSSSVSSRPIRDKRRAHEDRKKVRDIRGINKRFQRLESHVVTLARSVAHLSSEMRTQHLMIQEMENIRGEIAALRAQTNMLNVRSQSASRPMNSSSRELPTLANPARVKKLTKFFGDEPPLLRLFLRNLGYEKYANVFENERIGMVELPYMSEERLQKMGVPLGPRLRIMQEAQISVCKDNTLCIV